MGHSVLDQLLIASKSSTLEQRDSFLVLKIFYCFVCLFRFQTTFIDVLKWIYKIFLVIVLLGENGSPCCAKASFKLEVIKSPLSGKSKVEFCFGNNLGAIIK